MADQSDNQKRPPAPSWWPVTIPELLVVAFFLAAACVMVGDATAVDLSMLAYVSEGLPWWALHSGAVCVGVVLATWLLLRRSMRGWAALVGCVLAIATMALLTRYEIDNRIDVIELGGPLPSEQRVLLEKATGCRIHQRAFKLLFLRDPQRREQIIQWLKEHPSSSVE